ncbi:hypothetical protein F750_6285 [Streptomyces sp. PAMC 26508]|nr:hypothetical protein F750_6285 [Streptomyces sp. PAMC 26508]
MDLDRAAPDHTRARRADRQGAKGKRARRVPVVEEIRLSSPSASCAPGSPADPVKDAGLQK